MSTKPAKDLPLHKLIATGGSPKSKKTMVGTVQKSAKNSTGNK